MAGRDWDKVRTQKLMQRDAPPMEPRELVATRPGRCHACGKAITPGMKVVWMPGMTTHRDCDAAAKRPSAPRQPAVRRRPVVDPVRLGLVWSGSDLG